MAKRSKKRSKSRILLFAVVGLVLGILSPIISLVLSTTDNIWGVIIPQQLKWMVSLLITILLEPGNTIIYAFSISSGCDPNVKLCSGGFFNIILINGLTWPIIFSLISYLTKK